MTQSQYTPSDAYQDYGLDYHIEIPQHLHNVMDLLQPSFNQYGDAIAFSMGAATLTFAQLDIASRRFAAFLQAQNVQKGDRIAIQLPNILQFPVVMVGCLRAGVILVNINPSYTHHELSYQLRDSQACALVILNGMDTAYQQMDTEVKTQLNWVVSCSLQGDDASSNDIIALTQMTSDADVTNVANSANHVANSEQSQSSQSPKQVTLAQILADYQAQAFVTPKLYKEDLALLQYTGGTTGKPKGAMLTHYNILVNVIQCYAVFGRIADAEVDPKNNGQVKLLNPLPLYHIFSFSVCALLGMYAGWENILVTNPRDMDTVMALIERHKPHIIPSVNTLFNGMLQHPKFATLDFSHFKLAIGGGTSIIPAVAERWKAITGKNITEGYGMSETGPVVSFNPMSITKFNGTVGLPMPLTEVIILDEEGNRCATGERGEVCTKGPQIMRGYWQRDNAPVFTKDGYFKTGDIGFLDANGFLTLVDRKKDMILVSGFNVYPNEVEAALTEHPQVVEVAVVGVSDEHSGEVPKAFVVKKDDNLSEAVLREFASTRLAAYKRPQYYEFIAELPKSAVGKILRKKLRQ
ncbi:AMP-binding protein [Psychrobacter sp. I-STPA10]|uniref:AMP-binding protein n=1 Tax=Psychrobacter sp. I-STPA10 TaxID=2585769 RepID=UPI001E5EC30C|nr:AMP-binding protein [Psychrobacter sp. I-STPA10]